MCVSEPMTPATRVLTLGIGVLERSPPSLLMPDMTEQRERERNDDEYHHRAADRPREEDRPVVLVADHARHERALGLRAEYAAQYHRRDREPVLLEQVADD